MVNMAENWCPRTPPPPSQVKFRVSCTVVSSLPAGRLTRGFLGPRLPGLPHGVEVPGFPCGIVETSPPPLPFETEFLGRWTCLRVVLTSCVLTHKTDDRWRLDVV